MKTDKNKIEDTQTGQWIDVTTLTEKEFVEHFKKTNASSKKIMQLVKQFKHLFKEEPDQPVEEKRSAGRPPLALEDLPEGWQDKWLDMAAEGASEVEIRTHALDCICHETFTRLAKEHKIFSETRKKAKLLCQSWWERKGRVNLHDSDFITSLWFINMKNRFPNDWRDKRDVDHTTKGEKIQPAFGNANVLIPHHKQWSADQRPEEDWDELDETAAADEDEA